MQPSEWKAELIASLERARSNCREMRESFFAARRAVEYADTPDVAWSIQDWVRDTDRIPIELNSVLNELRKQEVKP